MKIWTYGESLDKITNDNDLQEIFEQDNAFINKNEMIGYFNEALTDASTEIQARSKDYFLTKAFLRMVIGENQIELPANIMANKIRELRYINGSINYEVLPYVRSKKFSDMSYVDQYGPNDYYKYTLMNDYSGQAKIEIHPAAREDSNVPTFKPLTLWYIRNCARVPLIGEFCNPELIFADQVETSDSSIYVSSGNMDEIGSIEQGRAGCYVGSTTLVTGDAVKFTPWQGGTLPAGIVKNTVYYVIVSGGRIQLAETKILAVAGTAITITTTGSGGFVMTTKATESIVAATILDIPEFNMYLIQFVKCKILAKERDPSLAAEALILDKYKQQMMDTLTDAVQDNNSDEIEADYSAYEELS